MRSKTLLGSAFALFLLIGAAPGAIAQSTDQDHQAHHPEGSPSATPPSATAPGGQAEAAAGMAGGMPGMMGMMTPEMMQMMQGMMGGAGPAGMGAMRGMGYEMPPMQKMRAMMEMCPMMQGMGGAPGAAEAGMMAMRGGIGPGVVYGLPKAEAVETTPEKVRAWLDERLALHANPRLTIGEIAPADDGSITAEIVTVDGSLVQKLAFNRWPGFVRRID